MGVCCRQTSPIQQQSSITTCRRLREFHALPVYHLQTYSCTNVVVWASKRGPNWATHPSAPTRKIFRGRRHRDVTAKPYTKDPGKTLVEGVESSVTKNTNTRGIFYRRTMAPRMGSTDDYRAQVSLVARFSSPGFLPSPATPASPCSLGCPARSCIVAGNVRCQ